MKVLSSNIYQERGNEKERKKKIVIYFFFFFDWGFSQIHLSSLTLCNITHVANIKDNHFKVYIYIYKHTQITYIYETNCKESKNKLNLSVGYFSGDKILFNI